MKKIIALRNAAIRAIEQVAGKDLSDRCAVFAAHEIQAARYSTGKDEIKEKWQITVISPWAGSLCAIAETPADAWLKFEGTLAVMARRAALIRKHRTVQQQEAAHEAHAAVGR